MNSFGRKDNTEEKNKADGWKLLTKETLGMVLILFACLCLLCLITRNLVFGDLGSAVSGFLLGVFGWTAYLVLISLIALGVELVKGSKVKMRASYKALFSLFLISAILLGQAITTKSIGAVSYGKYLSTVYKMGGGSFGTATSGGILFGLVDGLILAAITKIGCYVLYSVLIALSVSFTALSAFGKLGGAVSTKPKKKKDNAKFAKFKAVSGSRDYPLGGEFPDLNENGEKQNGLYYGDDDFEENGRERRRNAETANQKIKILYPENGGLAVGEAEETANDEAEKRKKIEYIKTPYTIIPPVYGAAQKKENGLYPKQPSDNFKNDESANIYGAAAKETGYGTTIIRSNEEVSNGSSNATLNGDFQSGKYFSDSRIGGDRIKPPKYFMGGEKANAEKATAEKNTQVGQTKTAPFMYSDNLKSNEVDASKYSDGDLSVAPIADVKKFTEKTAPIESIVPPYIVKENAPVSKTFETSKAANDISIKSFDKAEKPTASAPLEKVDGLKPIIRPFESLNESSKTSERIPSERSVSDLNKPLIDDDVLINESEELPPPTNVRRANTPLDGSLFGGRENRLGERNAERNGANTDRTPERGTNSVSDGLQSARRTPFADNASKIVETESSSPIIDNEESNSATEKEFVMPIHIPYNRPPTTLFKQYTQTVGNVEAEHAEKSLIIENTLEQFGIPAKVVRVSQGPTVTRYELKMPEGIRVNKVVGIADDIAMHLCARTGVIIQAPIPGTPYVGIQVENKQKVIVGLRDILESKEFNESADGKLNFAIGKDLVGKIFIDNLAKAPHLLVAGTTGTGKSVCLNSLITSLIYKYGPEDMRMVLVDPKKVEFSMFAHIPHLLFDDIVTDVGTTIAVLDWLVNEMERRYTMFMTTGMNDINMYNEEIASDETPKMVRIVVIVDELGDFMSTRKRDIEERIQRLAAKARAAGIHLVLATQRPSVDVITGVVKANLPARIACRVATQVDAMTIHGEGGAEKLLGNGDMLYKSSTMFDVERIQGAFVSNSEIRSAVQYIRDNNACYFDPTILPEINKLAHPTAVEPSEDSDKEPEKKEGKADELFVTAVRHVMKVNSASANNLQAKFSIGYATATRLLQLMVDRGIVSDYDGAKSRRILMTPEEFENKYGSNS